LSSKYELINKINDKLYDDNSKQKSLDSLEESATKKIQITKQKLKGENE
jgi:CHASE3 domain sensor protein